MLNLLEIFFLVTLDAFISLVIASSDQLFFCFEPLHWCSSAAYDISREIRLKLGNETRLRLYTKKKIFFVGPFVENPVCDKPGLLNAA